MENIIPLLLLTIILAIFGLLLALPMRLPIIPKLWQRYPLVPSTISFMLALVAFATPFTVIPHLNAQITYVFSTLQPHGMTLDPTSPEAIYRDAIITEMWLRAVIPPSEQTCFTQITTACTFADENVNVTWSSYLFMIGFCLIPVAVNQWAIWRWRLGRKRPSPPPHRSTSTPF